MTTAHVDLRARRSERRDGLIVFHSRDAVVLNLYVSRFVRVLPVLAGGEIDGTRRRGARGIASVPQQEEDDNSDGDETDGASNGASNDGRDVGRPLGRSVIVLPVTALR